MLLLVLACQSQPSAVPRIETDDPTRALEQAEAIEDPIARGAAVNGWIREHKSTLHTDDGLALCALLQQPEEGVCRRNLQSAHLE